MAFRLYLIPVIGVGTHADPRRPKYFDAATVLWTAMDYGFEPWMVVGADLAAADDTALVAQADVTALPFDLTPLLTIAQVANVTTKLEAGHIPAGWVSTSLTWTQVVRTVLRMFQFFQRFGAVYADATGRVPPSIFGSGITLNTTFGALSDVVQAALLATAASFQVSTAGLTAHTTVRQILRALVNDFVDDPLPFGSVMV